MLYSVDLMPLEMCTRFEDYWNKSRSNCFI